jgi:adenylate cyclase
MSKGFDYTTYTRRFATRFPVFSYLLLQIFFWVIAYAFLAILTQLVFLSAGPALHAKISLEANLVIAIFFGFFYGIASGYAGWLFEKKIFKNKTLGIIILGKAIVSLLVFVALISVVRSVVYPYLQKRFLNKADPATLQQSWDAFFYLLLFYNIAVGLVISFVNQVNRKYGPGVLLPLLLGKYRKPKEEERIFLFMDLKSSTSIAEALGHLKYSGFIRDSFMDINALLPAYDAQIYQYVGDEIVITWTIEEGLKNFSCVQFFFACEDRFNQRSAHYLREYGQAPVFKAGIHMGKVTVVEVGDIKRDIAYHGDTINTAARIQEVCNKYNKSFLTSVRVWENTEIEKKYAIESLGVIELKGKRKPVEIASVSRR